MSDVRCKECDFLAVKIAGGKNLPQKFRCKNPVFEHEFELPPEKDVTREPPSEKSEDESINEQQFPEIKPN